MFDEETLENVTMEILKELEYECINGYEMERTDFSKVLLEEDLLEAIERMNRGIEFVIGTESKNREYENIFTNIMNKYKIRIEVRQLV